MKKINEILRNKNLKPKKYFKQGSVYIVELEDSKLVLKKNNTDIYPPFNSIEGLGDTVANNIVKEREKRNFLSIEEVQYRAKVSGTLIDKMKSMGIFNGMSESNQLSLFD